MVDLLGILIEGSPELVKEMGRALGSAHLASEFFAGPVNSLPLL
jgi:hypothetical protein